MNLSHTRRGFTLVETFITMAIIACVASLLVPAAENFSRRAESITCANNLRQIGVTGYLYAADNNQRLPTIEPWPSDPVYAPEDNVKNIFEVLEPYGLTKQTLVCRADIRGPNYNAKEGSSYQWCPMANDQNLQAANLSWGNAPEGVSLKRILVAFDYTNIHEGASNILFGDGHVGGAAEN